jgi:4-diphosphocytidyl-2-C-methyl-D-erythritol kinase
METTKVFIKAYAKINLCLEIQGRRRDQYHEICSVVQTISLADDLVIQAGAATGTMLRVQGYPVPSGDDNLVMAALRLVSDRLSVPRDVEIQLNKRIPPGRGLGGGSSDAAAVLRALGCLRNWRLSREALTAIAAEAGSDVSLFLQGGVMLVSGRGEKVRRLPQASPAYTIALAWPEVSVPTGAAYGLLEERDFSDGSRTDRLWEHLAAGGQPEPELLCNGFERTVFAQWEPVASLHRRMSELAGVEARLTGSGSAIFAITDRAEAVVEQLRAEGYEAVVAQPVEHGQDLSCDAEETCDDCDK